MSKDPHEWTIAKSACHIQFEPSPNSHLGLANAVSALSENYPHAQQGQVPASVPVQTENGVVMQQGQAPQWILRHKDRAHQTALTPISLTVEEFDKSSGRKSLLSDTEILWTACSDYLSPTRIGQVGVRTTVAFPYGVPLIEVLQSNNYIPDCLISDKAIGSARVEQLLSENLQLVLSVGANSKGFPILDIDLLCNTPVTTDWNSLQDELNELYKQTELVLDCCIKGDDAGRLVD